MRNAAPLAAMLLASKFAHMTPERRERATPLAPADQRPAEGETRVYLHAGRRYQVRSDGTMWYGKWQVVDPAQVWRVLEQGLTR